MNDAVIQAEKFVTLVKRAGYPVKSAVIFGSYAKGRPHKWSDIDVCVVSDAFGKDYFDEMVKLKIIAIDVDVRIEPVPLTQKDLNYPLDTLASEIRKHSIPLKV